MIKQNIEFEIDFSKIVIVSDLLKLLSNPDRLKILCILKDGELHVKNIEQQTQITQPTLSQQLTILRNGNLLTTRREGKLIYYSILDHKILNLMQSLYELYCKN
ncbi:ArsR/SmtB family transcription factor [Acinetobacter gerneri]|jgi:DNA-binding transcriptional ArsR family regulator|uniref:HTH arsR-type domain-containing protein n=1 Tax=Acinetobacter gerneri DSM 14967 = CIP 107464 = MTCC 9824 TaxID=1120926 RepID=N8ZH53_9GAMM|nr:metalloregulator ArsR/SmtB family transcription factor [Acinetobacter gerneri]ENV33054.1 hypothetical protein F960_02776 [Acinetobacter gerneri DSM 14967 = CIP 107464 = MTCC 9824]MCH4242593.1 metalloregulator ArsR/SmtB family transcription factor [Acinetobacter gerneri]MDV2442032.1 metalloregulator ArsR/SmtB family transcription factor [Acinetobacter gerneri]